MIAYVVAVLLTMASASHGYTRNRPFLKSQELAPLYHGDIPHIKDEYVVVLLKDVKLEDHLKEVNKLLSNGESLLDTFESITSFKAYGAKLSEKSVKAIRGMKGVAYVEHNIECKLSVCTDQNGAPWGLKRTTRRNLAPVEPYHYDALTAGSAVEVYVIDSGIDIAHVDFGGRASWGEDLVHAAHSPNYRRDLNGHGTHVAGTIVGTTYGMAKAANAIAVKVFDAAGGATTIRVLRAIDYVVNNDRLRRRRDANRRRAVINMSFGMAKTQSVNDAVNGAVGDGLVAVAAAGNSQADACNYSPASAASAITVMASNNADNFATGFSNFGRCADIIAPGVAVDSAQAGGGHVEFDGTSMAAPHVSGAIAKYLSSFAANAQPTPAEVEIWLLQAASNGRVNNVPNNTPNKLLYYRDC